MRRRLGCAALAAVAALIGCGGTQPAVQATQPPWICAAAPPAPAMVYPMDGATDVPDGDFTLLLTGSASTLTLDIGAITAVGNLQPAPIPSPVPSPSLAATPGAGYAVPALQPATTYQVAAALPTMGCFNPNDPPPQQFGVIGSFTTK